MRYICLLFFLPILSFAQQWDHIIENIDTTQTINLTDHSWDNTLIRNCVIHHTGAGNDGIFLRNVHNVRIENCVIHNIDGQGGIRFSISGDGTDSVQIINNRLYNLQGNGINAPQRSQNVIPLNQNNLLISGNVIFNTGLGSNNGLHHAIYCQAGDFTIKDNIIFGERDGNGISVRSSGKIQGNIVSGFSKSNKPAIRYYSDHYKGASDSLLIENNILYNDSSSAHVLDIFNFTNLYENSNGDSHIVKNFNIRFNTIVSLQSNKSAIRIGTDFNQNGYSTIVEGNLLVNNNQTSQLVSVPASTILNYNLEQNSLVNFQSDATPYNFRLKSTHNAINFIDQNCANFPMYDIDGELRIGQLDAGADEYYSTSGILNTSEKSKISVFPNPIPNSKTTTISNFEAINHIELYNSAGKKILNIRPESTSDIYLLNLAKLKSGLYFLFVNDKSVERLIIK